MGTSGSDVAPVQARFGLFRFGASHLEDFYPTPIVSLAGSSALVAGVRRSEMKIDGTDCVSWIVVSSSAPSISMVAVAGRFFGGFALLASARNDAMVVADYRVFFHGFTAWAPLVMKQVRT